MLKNILESCDYFIILEFSRNVQSENTQNLGWAEVRRRDEPVLLKSLVPQVGDHLR